MSFTSIIFLFFFFPFAIIVHTFAPNKIKNIVLLILSLVFYSWGQPVYILLMLLSTAVTWVGVNLMDGFRSDREQAKFYLVCIVVFNVAILGFFKYYGFLIDNINAITGLNLKIIALPLPFGISFYTFKMLSYIGDVYKGVTKPQKKFSDLLLYISIFPQIGAGPIVKYHDMESELANRTITMEKFGIGVEKFIFGLGKKVIIANNLALIWAQVKGIQGMEMSTLTAWIGIISFTLQIYFDFSGYSDMAIGLGYMMGFKWAENFNYPYISKSATEFWRRWHISLGNWFKEYIYFPLGGSRCSKIINMRNIFIVWFTTGLWHGARWNFIIWGLYFGFVIYLEKVKLLKVMEKLNPKIQVIYGLLIAVIGWVMFDVDGVHNILKFYGSMFVFGANGVVDNTGLYFLKTSWRLLIPAIIGATPAVLGFIDKIKKRFGKKGYIAVSIYYVLIVFISVASLVGESYSPFLYFKF